MVPEYYLEIICCPRCKADLIPQNNDQESLSCSQCRTTYPVIGNIPILLDDVQDTVSGIIKDFYDSGWKRDQNGILSAKIEHEDFSDFGQKYITVNEAHFLPVFEAGGRFFLDAAAGAQPRINFGKNFSYHVCVDFSLDGLMESRQQLGERAICIVGSLLNLPIKNNKCGAALASHCLYHIEAQLQQQAIGELLQTVNADGTLLIFYGNPHSLERRIITTLKTIIGRKNAVNPEKNFYYYAHPINTILKMLFDASPSSAVTVKSLRMFSRKISAPLFRVKFLKLITFELFSLIEFLFRKTPSMATYVTYIVHK